MCVNYKLYVLIINIFFFKQKTAYEMRISDWSSDVCSSDLVKLDACVDFISYNWFKDGFSLGETTQTFTASEPGTYSVDQIGRASCRERVCQTCRLRWSPYH